MEEIVSGRFSGMPENAVAAAESGSSAPVEGITLIADRSFLYGIVDLQTGIPLFLGTFE